MTVHAVRHRPRARKMPAAERREQILRAALDLFARSGYSSTGTGDIAAAAGVGEPTLYRYFANKQDLYLEVIRWNADAIRSKWEEIAARNTDGLSALIALGRDYAEQLARSPEPLQLHFRAFGETHDPRVRQVVSEKYRELMALVGSLFARAQAQGTVRRDADVRTLTWSFMAFGALLDVTNLLGLQGEIDMEQMAAMTRLIIQGERA